MIRVTDNAMVSDAVDAPAFRLDHWLVPWLPKRILDRKEAVMAMHLAEIYSGDPAEDSSWAAVAHDYERELGLPRGFRPAWLRVVGPDLGEAGR